MNDQLPKSTEELLRDPLPETDPRPGFETRLLSRLHDAPRRHPLSRILLPVAASTALLLALLITIAILPNPGRPADASTDPASQGTTARPVLDIEVPNPLREQTTALADRATRTGLFLIDCLPSFPDPESQL